MWSHEYIDPSHFDGAQWRKSSISEPQQSCVEFSAVDGVVGIRDSKVVGGPILQFNKTEVKALLTAVKNGEFDDLA